MHRSAIGFLILAASAAAQQKEPAFEVYGLGGLYFHGNLSVSYEWKPQFGGGVLAPVSRNYGLLTDITTSSVEGFWNHDGFPIGGPGSNSAKERRIVLTPSFVRLWRRDRFSIYAGFGLGLEHERQRARARPIVSRGPNGEPVLGPDFRETATTRTDTMLVLRTGGLINISRRVVARIGFSLLPRYVDEAASKSVELGLGYRF